MRTFVVVAILALLVVAEVSCRRGPPRGGSSSGGSSRRGPPRGPPGRRQPPPPQSNVVDYTWQRFIDGDDPSVNVTVDEMALVNSDESSFKVFSARGDLDDVGFTKAASFYDYSDENNTRVVAKFGGRRSPCYIISKNDSRSFQEVVDNVIVPRAAEGAAPVTDTTDAFFNATELAALTGQDASDALATEGARKFCRGPGRGRGQPELVPVFDLVDGVPVADAELAEGLEEKVFVFQTLEQTVTVAALVRADSGSSSEEEA